MTRKDYILIAEALITERPQPNWENKYLQWEMDCRAIAGAFERDNPRFDRQHFFDVVYGRKALESRPKRRAA